VNYAGQEKTQSTSKASVISVIILSIFFYVGLTSVADYFRLGQTAGLGLAVPFEYMALALFGNMALVAILVKKVTVYHRKELIVFFIALSINVIAIGGFFGNEYLKYTGRGGTLSQLADQRHDDTYDEIRAIEGCDTLTDYNYWNACVVNKNITTEANYATCVTQSKKFLAGRFDQQQPQNYCVIGLAVGIKNVSVCDRMIESQFSGTINKLYCRDSVNRSY